MPVSVKIKPSAYILLALLVLTVPIPWLFAAIFAAYVHELCHIIALIFCKCTIRSVVVGPFGAKICTSPLSCRQEFLCALAGPCGSFLLVSFICWIPRIAICGLFQGLYNLLPVYPMDGGRIFQYLISSIRGKIPCKEAELKVQ